MKKILYSRKIEIAIRNMEWDEATKYADGVCVDGMNTFEAIEIGFRLAVEAKNKNVYEANYNGGESKIYFIGEESEILKKIKTK